MNKEAAGDCVVKAISYLSEGKIDKAEKLLNKSIGMHPTKRAEELLEKIKSGAYTSDDGVRKRGTAGQSAKSAEPKYTPEQLEAVKRIEKCKDYYEMLGVSKGDTVSVIKKAFKKLALQLHPDKNHAPGSMEAFIAIGNAVATLTDVQKRKSYDLSSADKQNQNARYEYTNSRGFETKNTGAKNKPTPPPKQSPTPPPKPSTTSFGENIPTQPGVHFSFTPTPPPRPSTTSFGKNIPTQSPPMFFGGNIPSQSGVYTSFTPTKPPQPMFFGGNIPTLPGGYTYYTHPLVQPCYTLPSYTPFHLPRQQQSRQTKKTTWAAESDPDSDSYSDSGSSDSSYSDSSY